MRRPRRLGVGGAVLALLLSFAAAAQEPAPLPLPSNDAWLDPGPRSQGGAVGRGSAPALAGPPEQMSPAPDGETLPPAGTASAPSQSADSPVGGGGRVAGRAGGAQNVPPGSRPPRFLPTAAAGGGGREAGSVTELSRPVALDGSGCPRAQIQAFLASAVEGKDVVSALAIERETLRLCRDRQELLAEVYKGEQDLRAALAAPSRARPDRPTSETPAPGHPAQPQYQSPPAQPQYQPPPPPALLWRLAPVPEPGTAGSAPSEPAESVGKGKPAATSVEKKRLSYSWWSIIGSAGRLVAGVSDGKRGWYVAVGHSLPGPGAHTIEAIRGRPPGVRLDGGIELPRGPRPGVVLERAR